MTVTGVRWAESNNRRDNQGIVTVQDTKTMEAPEGFRKSPRHGSLILVNDSTDNRRLIEQCYRRKKTVVNPIIDWEDDEVWEFIRTENIPYCELYDQGFHRLGCIGCPIAGHHQRERDFLRYPKFKEAYLKSFDRMLQKRMERHLENPKRPLWKAYGQETEYATAIDVFNWWMEYRVLMGQMNWFEDFEEEDDD